jgi:hypothetical protein
VKIAFDLGKRKRPRIEDTGGSSHTGKEVILSGNIINGYQNHGITKTDFPCSFVDTDDGIMIVSVSVQLK